MHIRFEILGRINTSPRYALYIVSRNSLASVCCIDEFFIKLPNTKYLISVGILTRVSRRTVIMHSIKANGVEIKQIFAV